MSRKRKALSAFGDDDNGAAGDVQTMGETKRHVADDLKPLPLPFLIDQVTNAPRCLRELELGRVAAVVRDKRDWARKWQDAHIQAKWLSELACQTDMDADVLSFVKDELTHQSSVACAAVAAAAAAVVDKHSQGTIAPGPVDRLWLSDDLIPDTVRADLVRQVSLLENVSDEAKDWHPGSNQQVLDLVHPSLYCWTRDSLDEATPPWPDPCDRSIRVYSRKVRVEGKVRPTPFFSDSTPFFSDKFQWLPSEFDVDRQGRVTIASYINNLNPTEHAPLYATIAAIFERFVPMFERVLFASANVQGQRNSNIIDELAHEWRPPLKPAPGSSPELMDEDDDECPMEREPVQPAIPRFDPKRHDRTGTLSLLGRRLQVIVKLANIILTPSRPKYPGGAWHVEGMENEAIVASGIYYYDARNIKDESRLAFRASIDDPSYEQGDDVGVRTIYGLQDGQHLNQPLGFVSTLLGRCIAFPNVFQHQVQPFELADHKADGVRKILVFFLVDPAASRRVVSTRDVPPQQTSWYVSELTSVFQDDAWACSRLSAPLVRLVAEYVGMPHQDALRYRSELMTERKFAVDAGSKEVFERAFSLCEH